MFELNTMMIIGLAGLGVSLLIGLISIFVLRAKRKRIERDIRAEYDHSFVN